MSVIWINFHCGILWFVSYYENMLTDFIFIHLLYVYIYIYIYIFCLASLYSTIRTSNWPLGKDQNDKECSYDATHAEKTLFLRRWHYVKRELFYHFRQQKTKQDEIYQCNVLRYGNQIWKLAQILTEIYQFKILTYFVTWWGHQWCHEYAII